MSDATLSLVIVGIAVALFIWNRLPVDVVAIGVALLLYFTGLIDTRTLFSGFGDPVIVFIASLFVVSAGLEASGVTAWVSETLARLAGQAYTRLLVTVLALGAVISAVITVNGAAAALVPVTVAVARHARTAPSKVLIPLTFGCSAGALLTLGGSPVNILIYEASVDNGGGGFGYFEFALIGIPLVLVTIAVAVLFGRRLLPERESTTPQTDFGGDMPVEHSGLERSAPRALAVLATMVGLLVSGIMPPAVAALLAALAMVSLRVVRTEQVYRVIPWQTIILIGALIPLSTAIKTSGAAEVIAAPIVELVGDRSPYLLLGTLFVLTALLGQFISNVATVLVVIPIAVAAATASGVSIQATLMLVALAGAASLLTPIATPANMIVLDPGGYRFGDYWRLGSVTMLTWFAVAMVVIPLCWPLH
ncbi:SLC13 family permease [Mycolicibacterium sp. HK-90]|uniref:SLC13 family permease n=1 Tax=Mycolicibacterium sp. HK-90 TaxID=3056937 RepID=UPI002657F209|nr:SLC13 family permease [Mycolicibacterium sp. HK-90]WKG04594.1 SLC13 family permease [Mycolicibacterium sp. HK-90]